ncbi:MAG TPA: Gfo/Idh/MocA family oxidoreductase [Acidobacteriaceae bacterium]|nr:Gfo/Idh/MocA family oxidoreductase [Acidobacteriaceae bacterium]
MSDGNGHPFSYSAIINGYSPEGLAASGWTGIYNYVRRRHASEFGFPGWSVTHAWTQDPDTTRKLCAAARIPEAVGEYSDILGKVDAIIIARDDFEKHLEMARPFLEAGTPVFIDKPLALSSDELSYYEPFLESGRLMSCSGMRYARELDDLRANLPAYGKLRIIRGAVVLTWEKYGVHLLEAILSTVAARPLSVRIHAAPHASALIRLQDDILIHLDALGDCPPVFRLDFFGAQQIGSFDITDNFSMFRRMLWEFLRSIQTSTPAIPAQQTLDIMRVLIAGRMSAAENREIALDEIPL